MKYDLSGAAFCVHAIIQLFELNPGYNVVAFHAVSRSTPAVLVEVYPTSQLYALFTEASIILFCTVVDVNRSTVQNVNVLGIDAAPNST